MTAIYNYIAKEDGRRPRCFRFACAAPLRNEEGGLEYTGEGKCRLLADHFEKKLSTGERLTGYRALIDTPEEAIMQKLRRKCFVQCSKRGDFNGFANVEITKAIRGMAKGKSPGPDGLHAEISPGLPALTELLRCLFNSIIRTGSLPEGMTRLFMVPLGEDDLRR